MAKKQQSIFGAMQRDDKTKELNKAILERAQQSQKQARTMSARVTVDPKEGKRAALIAKVQAAVEVAKQKLIPDDTYEIIRDEARLVEYVDTLIGIVTVNPDEIIGIDFEATSLDPITGTLVGTALYIQGTKEVYIPHTHTDYFDKLLPNQISFEVMARELMRLIAANAKFVYHNAKFDMRYAKNAMGVLIPVHWDTSLGSNFLNEYEPHGLKPLWDKYVSKDSEKKSEQFSDLFDGIPFNYVPIELGAIYAAKDPRKTVELCYFQKQYLTETAEKCIKADLVDTARLHCNWETPLIPVLRDMEERGVGLDKDMSKELSVKYNRLKVEAEAKCQAYLKKLDYRKLNAEQRGKLGNPINLNSPIQLQIVLYDVMELPSVERKSPRGTGEKVLEKLKERLQNEKNTKDGDKKKHVEFFDLLLEYRGIAKLVSTYIDNLPDLVKEKTGKIHTQYNQYGARTGRFSSEAPNLQNIPSKNKEIRKMFIPSIGFVFIGGDFSQQEPRALAHLCFVLFQDRKMLDAYLAGKDLYSWMAAEIYKVSYEECKEFRPDGSTNAEGKKRRNSVKSILLGLMYGRSTASVAEQMEVTEAEAQKIVDMLFNEFPGILRVIHYYEDMVREKGYVKTIYGRKCRIPDFNLPDYQCVYDSDRKTPIQEREINDYYVRKMRLATGYKSRRAVIEEANSKGIWIEDNTLLISEAQRQILNSVIQGTGADITKIAMVLVGTDEQLKEWGFHLLLTVHDELIGEAPEATARKCAERMRELMLKATEGVLTVPMSVDCEITRRWFGEDITNELAA
jgi:DNA polymerase I-like protein with 3'-5' exonuclease and polymerase domains